MAKFSLDIDHIVRQTPLRDGHFVESTASTNDLAKKVAKTEENDHRIPLLIVTTEQTAGRGRQGNTWWSGPGSLTFSLLAAEQQTSAPALISIAAAVALSNSIEHFGPQLNPTIKWPNDVYLAGRKVAGILIESIQARSKSRLIIGVGLNLNCSLRDAPAEVRGSSTTILDHLGDAIDPSLFLIDFVNRLIERLDSIDRDPEFLIGSLSERNLWPDGTLLTVRISPQSEKTGRFAGFGNQGQLILRVGSELVPLHSGSIEKSSVD